MNASRVNLDRPKCRLAPQALIECVKNAQREPLKKREVASLVHQARYLGSEQRVVLPVPQVKLNLRRTCAALAKLAASLPRVRLVALNAMLDRTMMAATPVFPAVLAPSQMSVRQSANLAYRVRMIPVRTPAKRVRPDKALLKGPQSVRVVSLVHTPTKEIHCVTRVPRGPTHRLPN